MSTIVRWNPFREMAAMQSALDRMFDDSWRTSGLTFNGSLLLDVLETDEAYTVVASIPGVEPDQFNIKLHHDALTISADLPRLEVPEGTRVLLQERPFGTISRSISLPAPVNANAVEANYQSGLLTLTLPKSPEAQPRSIPVKSSGQLMAHNN
ncbi:MAG: Hsp20/alpha crystallin family protein [Anaerolineae bacterium]|nr:Hsp20/alpha crystallin family protein [Anaerolineae bacterium]